MDEIVDDDDLMPFLDKTINQMRPDKSGASGHKYFHACPPSPMNPTIICPTHDLIRPLISRAKPNKNLPIPFSPVSPENQHAVQQKAPSERHRQPPFSVTASRCASSRTIPLADLSLAHLKLWLH